MFLNTFSFVFFFHNLETKWCGKANRAKNFDDLGPMKRTDMCCRTHDHCPQHIPGKGKKFGLENKSKYTASRCDCDMKFRACLHKMSVDLDAEGDKEDLVTIEDFAAATNIANLYFRHIEKCFLNQHPWTCSLNDTTQKENKDVRCRVYILDKEKPKTYQFFQLPFALDDGDKKMDNLHGRDFSNENKTAFTLDDLIPETGLE